MTEQEIDWTAATTTMSIKDITPSYNMTFHKDGKQIGVLDFNGPEMTFSGDMDESAKMFFDLIAHSFKGRLEQERKAVREWVGLTDKDIYQCEPKTDWYDSVEFARAIEAKLREKNA